MHQFGRPENSQGRGKRDSKRPRQAEACVAENIFMLRAVTGVVLGIPNPKREFPSRPRAGFLLPGGFAYSKRLTPFGFRPIQGRDGKRRSPGSVLLSRSR